MINKLYLYISDGTDPYENIAMETYLLEKTEEGCALLYLWQNKRTVVIGKNQDIYAECNCEKLLADGGCAARRLSGGGAVYHDMGNLNFSFIVKETDYDEKRQTGIILDAVNRLCITSEKTGRNDLVIDGKKFSGHAYYKTKSGCLHHGTILVDVDNEAIEKYLTVSADKLSKRGVDSVRSRVCCLRDYCPDLKVQDMKEKIIKACEEEYGTACEKWNKNIDKDRLLKLKEKFSSQDWIYNKRFIYTHEFSKRFSWGGVEVGLVLHENIIKKINIYSDSMDPEFKNLFEKAIEGTAADSDEIIKKLNSISDADGTRRTVKADLASLLNENIIKHFH